MSPDRLHALASRAYDAYTTTIADPESPPFSSLPADIHLAWLNIVTVILNGQWIALEHEAPRPWEVVLFWRDDKGPPDNPVTCLYDAAFRRFFSAPNRSHVLGKWWMPLPIPPLDYSGSR